LILIVPELPTRLIILRCDLRVADAVWQDGV